jgi:hypothetical protein
MTKREAMRQARSEFSRVFVTAATVHTKTWGFTSLARGEDGKRGWRRQNDIGSYASAVATRRAAIAERAAELMEEDEGVGL